MRVVWGWKAGWEKGEKRLPLLVEGGRTGGGGEGSGVSAESVGAWGGVGGVWGLLCGKLLEALLGERERCNEGRNACAWEERDRVEVA